jgi:hypothetical protein
VQGGEEFRRMGEEEELEEEEEEGLVKAKAMN